MSNGVDYVRTAALGDAAEQKVREHFEGKGFLVTKLDYKVFKYDLSAIKGDRRLSIEVKSYNPDGGFYTVPAEYEQYSTGISDYITYADRIDYIIWVNGFTDIGYVFDCKDFAKYVVEHKDEAKPQSYGTASTMKIHQECKAAGFLGTINL
jgi:hypothetical protein